MILALLISSGMLLPSAPVPKYAPLPENFSLKDLPSIFKSPDKFRAVPYINTACILQASGEEVSYSALRAAIDDKATSPDVVFVLCRMLYIPKPSKTFRRPELAAPVFFGGTKIEDWPLEPIEIIDGVPFLIILGHLVARGHFLATPEESPLKYLEYCSKECVWNSVTYKSIALEDRKKAVDKLLESKKWKKPLSDEEKSMLRHQIE